MLQLYDSRLSGNGWKVRILLSQLGIHVVGVASTVDNDLLGTDISIGSDTAINVTLEAIDHLRTTGSSHNRAFLVETMGRDCGYLAMMAGLAGGVPCAGLIANFHDAGQEARLRVVADRRERSRDDPGRCERCLRNQFGDRCGACHRSLFLKRTVGQRLFEAAARAEGQNLSPLCRRGDLFGPLDARERSMSSPRRTVALRLSVEEWLN